MGDGGPSACQECLFAPNKPGPGCGDALTACFGYEKCEGAVNCAIARGCLASSARDVSACSLSCLTEVGLVALDDPAFPKLETVFQCLGNVCAPICFADR